MTCFSSCKLIPTRATRVADFVIARLHIDRIRLGLRAFYETQDMALEPALRQLEGDLGKVLALEDAREGIAAFFQKRKPVWKGK